MKFTSVLFLLFAVSAISMPLVDLFEEDAYEISATNNHVALEGLTEVLPGASNSAFATNAVQQTLSSSTDPWLFE
eukprot:JP447888.1.p2 GENE.JP447888.1~~JP447888.1.p2  ORF type:complete len:75 (+),score=16.82 JP447888.1:201-425(+)